MNEEVVFFDKGEKAFCIESFSKSSDAILTEGLEYTVIAFNPDTDDILILDDYGTEFWVESDNFLNEEMEEELCY